MPKIDYNKLFVNNKPFILYADKTFRTHEDSVKLRVETEEVYNEITDSKRKEIRSTQFGKKVVKTWRFESQPSSPVKQLTEEEIMMKNRRLMLENYTYVGSTPIINERINKLLKILLQICGDNSLEFTSKDLNEKYEELWSHLYLGKGIRVDTLIKKDKLTLIRDMKCLKGAEILFKTSDCSPKFYLYDPQNPPEGTIPCPAKPVKQETKKMTTNQNDQDYENSLRKVHEILVHEWEVLNKYNSPIPDKLYHMVDTINCLLKIRSGESMWEDLIKLSGMEKKPTERGKNEENEDGEQVQPRDQES